MKAKQFLRLLKYQGIQVSKALCKQLGLDLREVLRCDTPMT